MLMRATVCFAITAREHNELVVPRLEIDVNFDSTSEDEEENQLSAVCKAFPLIREHLHYRPGGDWIYENRHFHYIEPVEIVLHSLH